MKLSRGGTQIKESPYRNYHSFIPLIIGLNKSKVNFSLCSKVPVSNKI